MYDVVVACAPLIEGHPGQIVDLIQNEFGKQVLSKGYTKLFNIARSCLKVASTFSPNIRQTFQRLRFALSPGWKAFYSSCGLRKSMPQN